jgi:hypothetical protein
MVAGTGMMLRGVRSMTKAASLWDPIRLFLDPERLPAITAFPAMSALPPTGTATNP